MIELDTDSKTGSRRRRDRAISTLILSVMCGIAFVLAGSIWYSRQRIEETDARIEWLELRRHELNTLTSELADARSQIQENKQVVWSLMRQCRVVEDLPKFATGHLFLNHRGDDGLALWLPAGNHRLIIKMRVKHLPDENGVTPEDDDLDWKVDLPGDAAYQFDLDTDRDGDDVSWKLTSSSEAFETQSGNVGLTNFRGSGWSTSGGDLVLYPNQLQRLYQIKDIEAAASNPPATKLFKIQLVPRKGGEAKSVDVEVELTSEGPATLSPGDAQSVIARRRGDLLKPYEGDGKVELKD